MPAAISTRPAAISTRPATSLPSRRASSIPPRRATSRGLHGKLMLLCIIMNGMVHLRIWMQMNWPAMRHFWNARWQQTYKVNHFLVVHQWLSAESVPPWSVPPFVSKSTIKKFDTDILRSTSYVWNRVLVSIATMLIPRGINDVKSRWLTWLFVVTGTTSRIDRHRPSTHGTYAERLLDIRYLCDFLLLSSMRHCGNHEGIRGELLSIPSSADNEPVRYRFMKMFS